MYRKLTVAETNLSLKYNSLKAQLNDNYIVRGAQTGRKGLNFPIWGN